MPVIDFHMHLMGDGYYPWIWGWMGRFLPAGTDPHAYFDTIMTKPGITGLLDDNGLDYAVVLAEFNPRCTGTFSNRELGEFCRGIDRLLPFGDVNPHVIADPVAELEHGVREWGFRGVKLYPVYELFSPSDSQLYPFYAKAQELGIVVMVHTGSSTFDSVHAKYGDPLLLDDVAADFPDLTLVMVHSGRGFWYESAVFLGRLYPNVYLEIAGLPPQNLLDYFPELEEYSDKIIFGSDWPGSPAPAKNIQAIRSLPISAEAKARILGDNAARILRLDRTAGKA